MSPNGVVKWSKGNQRWEYWRSGEYVDSGRRGEMLNTYPDATSGPKPPLGDVDGDYIPPVDTCQCRKCRVTA